MPRKPNRHIEAMKRRHEATFGPNGTHTKAMQQLTERLSNQNQRSTSQSRPKRWHTEPVYLGNTCIQIGIRDVWK